MLKLCAACVIATAQAGNVLPPAVTQELARQELPLTALSFQIEPVAGPSGAAHTLAERSMRSPASTIKLVTTLAALDALGPAYRWTTSMLTDGPPGDGELKGNLYLQGGGEPNLTWERVGGMLRALRNSGIVTIGGDLILDRTLFEPARTDLGLPPFDDTPDAWYNVIPDALTISDYLITYTLSANASRMTVQTTPPLAGVVVDNQLTLNDLPCEDWRETWRQPLVHKGEHGAVRIVLTGAFPRNCMKIVDLGSLDRNLYTERLVRALWREMGGQWNGIAREGMVPAGATRLLARQFDTLADTVRAINKSSHAVKARMLYLTLGATSSTAPGQPTLERARQRVMNWIATQGVDPAGIVIENGSGLSRTEQISTGQLSALLKASVRNRWYPEFVSSLPIVALDGTMKNRMLATSAASNARLKTGSLRDVTALAGFVRDVNGKDCVVAAFINDPQAAKGRAVLDRLMLWVSEGGVCN